ncbi:MAG TPA: chromate efflux transporter [Desulfobacterales bacterium]|nr:chromate efflux transporter [Desulfobacterales bacterium]
MANQASSHNEVAHPGFWEAFRFWVKLGFISFGGPAGQIAIMHKELVERRRWVSNPRFLNALNYCMLLPGPEAQQLAVYIGWLLHNIRGGVVAGALFVIPSMFILFGLSYVYVAFGKVAWVASIFDGLKAAVMAIVFGAVIRIGQKSLKNAVMISIAALSFVAIFFFKAPFPAIVIGAGLVGLIGGNIRPETFDVIKGKEAKDGDNGYVQICADPEEACHLDPSNRRSLWIIIVFIFMWVLPVAALALLKGSPAFLTEALFFTKAAFLTFGGAYAVLPYVAQAGVEQFGWLTGPQMMDGLGLAETTPGPLIMVLQFVGFMAGWNQPGVLSPFMGSILGSLVATYFTFLPCFLFIFLGAPYIEKFRGNRKLSASLSSITAAVVGVVLNLAVWFGLQILFPASGGFNYFSAAVGLAAFVAIQRFRTDIIAVVAGAALAGLLYHLV